MSLINQMLKDLERRSNRPVNSEYVLSGIHESTLYSLDKRYVRISLFFITLLVCCFFAYAIMHVLSQPRYHQPHPPIFATNQSSDLSGTKGINMPENVFDITPAMLTAITLQVVGNTTQLHLSLNHTVLYHIIQNDAKQITMILEKTSLLSNLPTWNTEHSHLSALDIINLKNGDVKLIMKLTDGAVLAGLSMNDLGKLPELQITITKLSPYDENAAYVMDNTSNNSIKKMRIGIPIEDDYQRAMQIYTQGNANLSVVMLTEILAKDPSYSPARESLATLLIEQKNFDKALDIIQTGLQQRPFYPQYVQLKARILVDQKKIAQALNLLLIAPPSLKSYPDYHAFIAALYQQQGKSELARQIYEDLLELQPMNGIWLMGLGIAYEKLGNHNQAANAFLKAINSDNLDPESKAYVETRVQNIQ